MRPRRLVAATSVTLVTTMLATITSGVPGTVAPPPAEARPGDHCPDGQRHPPVGADELYDQDCIPGRPPDEPDRDAPGPPDQGPAPPPECIDRPANSWEGDLLRQESWLSWLGGGRPRPDAYPVEVHCRDLDEPCDRVDRCTYRFTRWAWRVPGEDGEWTEIDLYELVMVELRRRMTQPEVATNPGDDQASIVHIPTFVRVTNWTGSFSVTECAPDDPTFCLTADVEPHMIFDPGEPRTGPIECIGPGVAYQPNIVRDAEHQARDPAACTHTYRYRTGVRDRPFAWPATVTVVWDVQWEPDDGTGTPQVSLTTDVPRQVHELQAVVPE